MKKFTALLMTLTILIMSFSICASAADMSDGLYEVPVTLMHKEDEKESFGNKYVAQTGLLEVKNGKKTVTIFLTTDMDGIEFSYYTNGTLDGDTKDGKSVKNVTVAGTEYEQGFEIPVMKSGDIGLKFSVPVMPMSPSARLRIDYASAKLIESYEDETALTTEVQTSEPASEEPVSDEPVTDSDEEASTEEASTEEIASEQATAESTTEESADEETTAEADAEEDDDDDNGTNPLVFVILFAAIACCVAVAVKKAKEKKSK